MLCPIRKPPSFPSKTPIPSGGASEGRCLVIDREEHDEADRSDEADDEELRALDPAEMEAGRPGERW
jgi:hypothetical protein